MLAGDRPTPTALSPRFLRWTIFLAAYNYSLVYVPGKSLGHADALSRCPLTHKVGQEEETCPVLLIEACQPGLITAGLVAKATRKDRTLQRVLSWALRGWPNAPPSEEFKPFFLRQGEISVQSGCLLWGERVVLPESLQEKALTTLHDGHPGIEKMKALARGYFWWPNMDSRIQEWVGHCAPCQESRPALPKAPHREWEKPASPWSRLHIDFAGPFHGKNFLLIVDAFSKWLEVRLMPSTTAEAVIGVFDALFATHGLPDVVVSDNGPQFTAMALEQYLGERGIRHALIAPYNPAANGLAERVVRSTKEALSRQGPGPWQEKINKFLAWQHVTPHKTTGRSPAELLMGRRLRTVLDRLHPNYAPDAGPSSDDGARVLQKGDWVHAKTYSGDRKWALGEVVEVTGPRSYIVALPSGLRWRRHIDQLRKAPKPGDLAGRVLQDPNGNFHAPPEVEEDKITVLPEADPRAGHFGEESQPPPPQLESMAEASRAPPAANPEAPAGTTFPAEVPPSTEVRRSSRPSRRPAYLDDYAC